MWFIFTNIWFLRLGVDIGDCTMNDIEIVREYLQCWGSRDMASAGKYLSSDCRFDDPLLGKSLSVAQFLEGAKAFIQTINAIDIISIVRSDEWVASYYMLKTNLVPEIHYSEWFRVSGSKIIEGRLIYDTSPIIEAFRKLQSKPAG
jgi:hypothetical protein